MQHHSSYPGASDPLASAMLRGGAGYLSFPGATGFNTDAFPLSAFTAPVTGKSERAAQLASSVSVLGSTLSPQEEFMPAAIPQQYLDLFQKKAFAHVATIMPDGSPQLTPVWVHYDGTYVRINSARGRVKDKNLRRNPHVALTIQDPDNPYRYLQIRGHIAEITEAGADDHIDKLAQKYLGKPVYEGRQPGEVRVLYKIVPDKVSSMG